MYNEFEEMGIVETTGIQETILIGQYLGVGVIIGAIVGVITMIL